MTATIKLKDILLYSKYDYDISLSDKYKISVNDIIKEARNAHYETNYISDSKVPFYLFMSFNRKLGSKIALWGENVSLNISDIAYLSKDLNDNAEELHKLENAKFYCDFTKKFIDIAHELLNRKDRLIRTEKCIERENKRKKKMEESKTIENDKLKTDAVSTLFEIDKKLKIDEDCKIKNDKMELKDCKTSAPQNNDNIANDTGINDDRYYKSQEQKSELQNDSDKKYAFADKCVNNGISVNVNDNKCHRDVLTNTRDKECHTKKRKLNLELCLTSESEINVSISDSSNDKIQITLDY